MATSQHSWPQTDRLTPPLSSLICSGQSAYYIAREGEGSLQAGFHQLVGLGVRASALLVLSQELGAKFHRGSAQRKNRLEDAVDIELRGDG